MFTAYENRSRQTDFGLNNHTEVKELISALKGIPSRINSIIAIFMAN